MKTKTKLKLKNTLKRSKITLLCATACGADKCGSNRLKSGKHGT